MVIWTFFFKKKARGIEESSVQRLGCNAHLFVWKLYIYFHTKMALVIPTKE